MQMFPISANHRGHILARNGYPVSYYVRANIVHPLNWFYEATNVRQGD